MAHYAVIVPRSPDYPHSHAFDEVALTLVEGFAALGHDVVASDHTTHPDRRCVLLAPQLLPLWPQPVPDDAILYNLEQLDRDSTWITGELIERFHRHELWDYSERNRAVLAREHGIHDVRLLPIGYSPGLERIAEAEPDIDVLFYGSPNDRRVAVLEALDRLGVRVTPLFGIYGAERDAYIARARIVLNMHFYDAQIFEQVRVSYLLANGRFVVSEGGDPEGEAAWADGLVIAPYAQLVETCLGYLDRDRARDRIRARGRELMRARPQSGLLAAVLTPSQ
jgi:hypothetical protein